MTKTWLTGKSPGHCTDALFGLSKVERPILDHHTKAHNLKSGGFHVKSTQNLINSDVSAKTLQFGWISCGFHVKSKDLLQGIVTLCLHL